MTSQLSAAEKLVRSGTSTSGYTAEQRSLSARPAALRAAGWRSRAYPVAASWRLVGFHGHTRRCPERWWSVVVAVVRRAAASERTRLRPMLPSHLPRSRPARRVEDG